MKIQHNWMHTQKSLETVFNKCFHHPIAWGSPEIESQCLTLTPRDSAETNKANALTDGEEHQWCLKRKSNSWKEQYCLFMLILTYNRMCWSMLKYNRDRGKTILRLMSGLIGRSRYGLTLPAMDRTAQASNLMSLHAIITASIFHLHVTETFFEQKNTKHILGRLQIIKTHCHILYWWHSCKNEHGCTYFFRPDSLYPPPHPLPPGALSKLHEI